MALSPLNEAGQPVDWWFLYKTPILDASGQTQAATGFEYAYYDDPLTQVVASPFKINSGHGALALTLDALFQNPPATQGYLLYNDEHPGDGPADIETCGHTKGIIGFDIASNSGFWLLHSWPKYPLPDGSAAPSPDYGQTFLCLALDLDQLGLLAAQMVNYQQPQVYDKHMPDGLPADHGLVRLAAGVDLDAPGGTNVITLTTRGLNAHGPNTFQVIAKNRGWGQDFWNDLVVDVLHTDLDVETWIRGGPKVIPDTEDPTKTYSVQDMKYVSLKAIDPVKLPWEWPESKDHAKWAISEPNKGDWICVGDINRMISQRQRGGCTIAFQDVDNVLWGILYETDVIIAPAGSGWSEAKTRHAIATVVWPKDDAAAGDDEPRSDPPEHFQRHAPAPAAQTG